MKKHRAIIFSFIMLCILLCLSACRERTSENGFGNNSLPSLQTASAQASPISQSSSAFEESGSGAIGVVEASYEKLLREGAGSLYPCELLSVYLEGTKDFIIPDNNSSLTALIIGGGGESIASDFKSGSSITADYILARNPDAIVKIVSGTLLGENATSLALANSIKSSIFARSGFSALSAIKNGKVLVVSEELFLSDNGKLLFKLLLAETLYPALFDFDAVKAQSELLPVGQYFA